MATDIEEWENSIEGIVYDLDIMGDTTTEDEIDTGIIAETLQKIPKQIKKKVLDKVTFILMAEATGTLRKRVYRKFLKPEKIKFTNPYSIDVPEEYLCKFEETFIILNFKGIKSRENKMITIVHEIAHYVLGHADHKKSDTNGNKEIEADDLIEKWGFKRAYKKYRIFKKNKWVFVDKYLKELV